MAEGFYNKKMGGQFAISAGIINSSNKYSGHPRPDVVQVMQEIGVDISKHSIKQVTGQMLDVAQKIIVFCDTEKCPKMLTDTKNVLYIKVDDPPDNKKTIGVLREMRDKIKQIVDNLP